jgi:hypothetical protein
MLASLLAQALGVISPGSLRPQTFQATAEMWPVAFADGQEAILPEHGPALRRAAQVGARTGTALLLCYRPNASRAEPHAVREGRLQKVTAALHGMGARDVEPGSQGFCEAMSKRTGRTDSTVQIFNVILMRAER